MSDAAYRDARLRAAGFRILHRPRDLPTAWGLREQPLSFWTDLQAHLAIDRIIQAGFKSAGCGQWEFEGEVMSTAKALGWLELAREVKAEAFLQWPKK